MLLETATDRAQKLIAALSPFCSQVDVSGSIYRGEPEPDDIDLIVLPLDLPLLRSEIQRRGRIWKEHMNYQIPGCPPILRCDWPYFGKFDLQIALNDPQWAALLQRRNSPKLPPDSPPTN